MKKIRTTLLLLLILTQIQAQERNIQYFLEQGMVNSPLLKDYQNQLLSAAIDSMRLRASYGFLVNGNSINTYAPVIHGYGYDNAISNGAQVSALVSASRLFVGKRNIENQFRAISLQNETTRNTAAITSQDLKKNITAQYITAYGDWAQYLFNQDVLKLLQEESSLLIQLTRAGTYKQTDYLTFLVTLQQQELLVKQLQAQYQNNYALLNYLCGLTDTAFHELPDPVLQPENIPGPEYTIFFRKFQLDSLQLKNSDAQIDYNYHPRISLFADGGYNSSLAVDPYKNIGVSAGVSLTVPIYDGKQRKMQHDKITLSEHTRRGYQDFFMQQYRQLIQQLTQQLQAAQQLIDQASARIKYAEGLIQANRKLLMSGDVRIADYIIAINNYLNAKNIITLNTINKYQLINQLNYWNRIN
ncbi:TolC family protein [Chitinophaga flava]|uniref:TolC family protein n=1 Tax=Chitinophaga flava TaxID=2259036 RepID=A0A365XRZ2_9BACT|nr:TolC family protein [Chitinophaga flava]RBL88910.1 hypothetical protein DF182_20385 [Chitinophaga flava]